MLDKKKINKIQMLADEINNFNDCYKDCVIYATYDGSVVAEDILAWLIENPHFAEIAAKIKLLEI